MADLIRSRLAKIGEFLKKTEKKKLILASVLILLILTAGIVGAAVLNRAKYTVLFSDLSAQEAGSILNVLKEMNVDAKAKGTDTILVPENQADDLRIELAAQGYPDTGLNYDLFSNSSAVGSTDLERQTYLQFQLQENMRSTICRMNKVKDCVVIVNLASSSSFVISDNTAPASAAVLLSLENGQKLTDSEAKTIGAFVMKCVPKLTLQNISIVDSNMNNYDLTNAENTDSADDSGTQQQLTEKMKEILTKQALHVLEPALGQGNVAVSVNLSLDFDKETVNSVEFSPPLEGETQGLLISSQEKLNSSAGGSADGAGGQPGTDSNGVSASEYVASDAGGQSSQSSDKTYNYELNQIQKQIEKARGAVQDLSVAVLINSDVSVSGQADTVKSLVANAIGADSKYISVELMPFVQNSDPTGIDGYFRQNQEAMERLGRIGLIKTAIMAVSILLAVFLVIRFLLAKKAAGQANEIAQRAPDSVPVPASAGMPAGENQDALLQEIMTKKSDEAEKVEKLIESYPDAVVQTIRTWLTEEN